MKHQLLSGTFLLLCAWLRTSVAQAAIADSVVAWGDNGNGQTTVPVTALSGVTAIAAGDNHTVALKDDGSVIAWGAGTVNNPGDDNQDYGQSIVPLAAQSGVNAIAAGVVSFSDIRHGYGNCVEINHGNGYVTRYAHNRVNLVAVGDKVEKGQTIALMGTTGRATGPNLHFEVLHYGKVVNPLKYINRKAG